MKGRLERRSCRAAYHFIVSKCSVGLSYALVARVFATKLTSCWLIRAIQTKTFNVLFSKQTRTSAGIYSLYLWQKFTVKYQLQPLLRLFCNWWVVGASRPAEKHYTDFNIASRLCCTAHEHCKSGLRFDRWNIQLEIRSQYFIDIHHSKRIKRSGRKVCTRLSLALRTVKASRKGGKRCSARQCVGTSPKMSGISKKKEDYSIFIRNIPVLIPIVFHLYATVEAPKSLVTAHLSTLLLTAQCYAWQRI